MATGVKIEYNFPPLYEKRLNQNAENKLKIHQLY